MEEIMTTYECISIWLQAGGLLIAGGGLVLIWFYVKYTKTIAEATQLQGDVLSRTNVSLACYKRDTSHQPFSAVNTLVANNSMVSASIKVTIKATLRISGADHDEEFLAPAPYDGTVWPFKANETFLGNLSFDGLKDRRINDTDTLTLVGTIESSAFRGKGKNVFKENPPIQYRWKHATEEWVPGPLLP